VKGVFTMASITRNAALDDAHAGDIRGALGTISADDSAPRAGLSAKLKTLLAIVGPGLIVMCGDNDAGAFSTYGQAGQNYGTRLLWTLLLLVPVLYVNQEMVLRLGAAPGFHEGVGELIALASSQVPYLQSRGVLPLEFDADKTAFLLDDALAEVPLVWSPDSSKIATSFGVDVGVYDAAGKAFASYHHGDGEFQAPRAPFCRIYTGT